MVRSLLRQARLTGGKSRALPGLEAQAIGAATTPVA